MCSFGCIVSHPLRRSAFAATIGVLSLAFLTPAAHADLVFYDGAGGVQPEENILLPSGQIGTTITGNTNQTGTVVTFTQPLLPESLTTPASGQARIASVDGVAYTSLRTSLGAGFTFSRFEANPIFTGSGITFTVAVQESDGSPITNHFFTSGSGNSFFGVEAINGQRISYINIIGATNSIQDVQQIRIGGIQGPGITPVPEPSEWLAMGMATASIGGLMVRARRRKLIKAA